MRTLLWRIGVALCISAGIPAQGAQQLLLYGDSLSAAYGLAQRQGWPALLQARLQQQGFAYQVINASISGETTSGGRSRIEATLRRHTPSIVVLALGANDGLRGLALRQMEENLDFIAQSVRRQGAALVVVGMRLPPNYGKAYEDKFRAVFTDVARRHQAALVPFLLQAIASERDMFQSDGLHPSAAAQPLILDTVWEKLLPLLKAKRAERRAAKR